MKFIDFIKINELVYYKGISDLIFDAAIPLTDKIQKIINKDKKEIVAYHATELKYLKDLKSLQGSEKPISTFTKDLNSVFKSISSKPEVVVKVQGNVVIESNYDIFSHPDKYGVRWLQTIGADKYNFLKEGLLKKLIDKLIDLNRLDNSDIDVYSIMNNKEMFDNLFNALSKENKKNIIDEYIEKVQKFIQMKMYKEIMLYNIHHNSNPKYTHNEILLNNIKILGVYAIQANKYRFNHDTAESDIEKLKLKYLGFIPATDFHKFN